METATGMEMGAAASDIARRGIKDEATKTVKKLTNLSFVIY
jgi:hypothetical protein